MEHWGRIAAGVAGGVVLLMAGAFAQARRAWRSGTDALVGELRADAGSAATTLPGAPVVPSDLPAPAMAGTDPEASVASPAAVVAAPEGAASGVGLA